MSSTRPPVEALSAERLAAWVDASCERADGLLFTASAREDLDGIATWQRLSDLAFAGQCRAIVATWNRAGSAEREFVCDEVGLAIGASPTAGSTLTALALSAAELPGLLESVESGVLTERHVRAVLRELDMVELRLDQRAAIVLVMLARFNGQTPGELATVVRRLILTVDLPAARRRQDTATRGRAVRCYPDVDGQAVLHARGPLEMIAAVKASLDATLSPQPDPGDDRSTDARMFDLFIDLLTGGSQGPGRWEAQILVPVTTAEGGGLELAEVPGFGPMLPSTAQDLLDTCHALRRVAVDSVTGQVLAVDDAVSTGRGCSVAEAAGAEGPRSTASRYRLLVDPVTGELLDVPPVPTSAAARNPRPADRLPVLLERMRTDPIVLRDLSSDSYRPSGRLARLVEVRDRSCTFPGCHRRATDKDHRIPWPLGPTSPANLGALCRHHHRAKHVSFTVTLEPDDTVTWTTRGGQRHHRRPRGY